MARPKKIGSEKLMNTSSLMSKDPKMAKQSAAQMNKAATNRYDNVERDVRVFFHNMENVPQTKIVDASSLQKIMDAVSYELSSYGLLQTQKIACLKVLRSLVSAGAASYEIFANFLLRVEPCIRMCFKYSPSRHELVLEACMTVAHLVQHCRLKAEVSAALLRHILRLYPYTALGITAPITASLIIKHKVEPSLIPIVIRGLTVKSQSVRCGCHELLSQMLHDWPNTVLEDNTSAIVSGIKRGMTDADVHVRATARMAMLALDDAFPELAERLFDSLAAGLQRRIHDDRFQRTIMSGRLEMLRGQLKQHKSRTVTPGLQVKTIDMASLNEALLTRAPEASFSHTKKRTGNTLRKRSSSKHRVSSTHSAMVRFKTSDHKQEIKAKTTKSEKIRTSKSKSTKTSSRKVVRLSVDLDRPDRREPASVMEDITDISFDNPTELKRSALKIMRKSINHTLSEPILPTAKIFLKNLGHNNVTAAKSQPIAVVSDVTENRDTAKLAVYGSLQGLGVQYIKMAANRHRQAKLEKLRQQESEIITAKSKSHHEVSEPASNNPVVVRSPDGTPLPFRTRPVSPTYRFNIKDDDVVVYRNNTTFGERKKITETERRENVADCIAKLRLASRPVKKEALLYLLDELRNNMLLESDELVPVVELIIRFLDQSNSMITRSLLEVLIELMRTHSVRLRPWIHTLLPLLLRKVGYCVKGTVVDNCTRQLLAMIRGSYRKHAQLDAITRYMTEKKLHLSIKDKESLLTYIFELITRMSSLPFHNFPHLSMALSQVIYWTSEPSSQQVRQVAREVLIELNKLNSEALNLLLLTQPETLRTTCIKILTADSSKEDVTTPMPSNRAQSVVISTASVLTK